jgi:biopolymer transport protein TolR
MSGSNLKRGQAFSEMNVVPFIDVMLVLLTVFMITTPVINESVNVKLPQAQAEKIEVTKDSPILIISVTKDEKLFLSLNGAPIKVNDIEDLTENLKDEKIKAPDAQLYLRGDTDVPYGTIMKVMSGLKNSGIKDIGLMTEAITE